MKGLLLKDFYMMRKYCRSYLFMAAIFAVVTFFSSDNLFFVFYPCMLCGIIPVNLIAYDEQSRFNLYSGTLPYTKAQIVSGKYLIGLLVQGAMVIIMGAVQAIKMIVNGNFYATEFLVIMLAMFCVSVVVATISMPFMFKLGVEKGRMAYLFTIGVMFAASFVFSSILEDVEIQSQIELNTFLFFLCIGCACLYALSWYLSIVFYNKREI